MGQKRSGYPSDVSNEEWALSAPYLVLMREDAAQRIYTLRSVFNAVRYLVRSGCGWRMLPNDFPPWSTVHQQLQRWIEAERFEMMAHDLREVLRVAAGPRRPTHRRDPRQPHGAIDAQQRSAGRLRRGQAPQGRESACGG